MMCFHDWNQEESTYYGDRNTDEIVAAVTVEDILHAMYVVGIELTDENLDTVIGELNAKLFAEFAYDLQELADRAINGEG